MELVPGGAKKYLSAAQARRILSGVRPRDEVGNVRKRVALELVLDLERIYQRKKQANKELIGTNAHRASRGSSSWNPDRTELSIQAVPRLVPIWYRNGSGTVTELRKGETMSRTATITIQITVDVPDESSASANPPVSVQISTATPVRGETKSNDAGLPDPVEEMLNLRAPHAEAGLYRRFLERCHVELDVTIATPASGDRPSLNIYPPAGRRGGRLAALNVKSGRLHVKLDPARRSEWQHAEVITNNGQPVDLRVYLTDESAPDALDMVRAALTSR